MRLIRRPETVTESTLAEIFAFRLKAKAVFCFDDKHWYLWNGEKMAYGQTKADAPAYCGVCSVNCLAYFNF